MDFLRAGARGLWEHDHVMDATQVNVKKALFRWGRVLAGALRWRCDCVKTRCDEHALAPVNCPPLPSASTGQYNRIFARASRSLAALVFALASVVGTLGVAGAVTPQESISACIAPITFVASANAGITTLGNLSAC